MLDIEPRTEAIRVLDLLSTIPARPLTLDDLALLPDDGRRFEIVDGSLIVSPPPTPQHQVAASNLYDLLRAAQPNNLRALTGGAGILLQQDRFLVPDVIVVAADSPGRGGPGFQPADVVLVVEVVSPSNAAHDLVTKRVLYEARGIEHYWIVDIRAPDAPEVLVLRLSEGQYVETRYGPADLADLAEPFAVQLRPRDLLR